MNRKLRLQVFKNHDELLKHDLGYWRSQTPEARIDQVELLRIEAGKFLYAYPTRLQRVITVTRRPPKKVAARLEDKADLEKLLKQ